MSRGDGKMYEVHVYGFFGSERWEPIFVEGTGSEAKVSIDLFSYEEAEAFIANVPPKPNTSPNLAFRIVEHVLSDEGDGKRTCSSCN